jgi:glucose/mannose-6-phosphate isomerase
MDTGETINLDELAHYSRLDPAGMLTHIHNFPRLCEQAWRMVPNFNLPENYSRVNKVVVLGMGGSAIGGDLVRSLVEGESQSQIVVCRDYDLPKWVDAKTLVIASSYSGMTEETLSAFEQALDTPSKKLAITAGGKLRILCENRGVPVFTFDYKTQPRAALPFSFFLILGALHKLRLVQDKSGDVAETLTKLNVMATKINEEVPSTQNPAKALARKLYGRLALIYGAGITAEVAHRWKTQINENAKSMAFYEVFSELNHNSVVGYSLPEELTRQTMVVMLDSELLHERIRLRYEITQKLLQQAGIYYHLLKGEGTGAMSQMLSLVLFGDYVSFYLAMLNQVDPTPVKPIDFLKDNLAKK